MNRSNYLFLIMLFPLAFLLAPIICNKTSQQSNNTDKLIQSVDSLKKSITDRDTLFIPRDSVVYRTNTIKQQIERYYTTHDTIERLMKCDTIIRQCDSLAIQYNRQDSLFRKQVSDLKLVVNKQDTVITDLQHQLKRKKRTNRILTGALIIATGAAILK